MFLQYTASCSVTKIQEIEVFAGCGKGSLTAITKVFWSVTDRFEVYNYAGSE